MIRRRTTLEDALGEIEAGTLDGVTAIVVNAEWWQEQPRRVQGAFRSRCDRAGIQLSADGALSRHFVELASGPSEPPLSTERRI